MHTVIPAMLSNDFYSKPDTAPESPPDFLTIDEAATFLRMDRDTLYKAARKGQVPHLRVGSLYRFSRTGLVLAAAEMPVIKSEDEK